LLRSTLPESIFQLIIQKLPETSEVQKKFYI